MSSNGQPLICGLNSANLTRCKTIICWTREQRQTGRFASYGLRMTDCGHLHEAFVRNDFREMALRPRNFVPKVENTGSILHFSRIDSLAKNRQASFKFSMVENETRTHKALVSASFPRYTFAPLFERQRCRYGARNAGTHPNERLMEWYTRVQKASGCDWPTAPLNTYVS